MRLARLPGDWADPMPRINHDWTAWTLVGDQAIFLDVLQDRYFGLAAPENSRFLACIARGELAAWHLPACLPKPHDWESPASGLPISDDDRLDLAGMAAAFWIQRRLERRMKTLPFHEFLIGIRKMAEDRLYGDTEARAEAVSGIVADFERARLVRSAANRCVPRALALVLRCAARGLRAYAVIGVRTRPFEAHCWAQIGSVVLTDPIEHVIPFQPILVI